MPKPLPALPKPQTTTLTAAIRKLEDYARLYQDRISLEALHSITGAIIQLGDAKALIDNQ